MIARGSIRWVDLGEAVTSAPAKRRPVVVISSDVFNRSRLATVIVAVVTSKTSLAEQPGNVFLPSTASGLPRDSVVNVTQLLTLDRIELGDEAGVVPPYLLTEIDRGLRLSLAV